MMHDQRIHALADYIEHSPRFDQSDPSYCVAGHAARLRRTYRPKFLRWLPTMSSPLALRGWLGISIGAALNIWNGGWCADRGRAADMLRRLAATGEVSWH